MTASHDGRVIPSSISHIRTVFQPIYEIDAFGNTIGIHAFECLSRGPANTNFERADVLFEYARRKGVEPSFDQKCIEIALRSSHARPPGASLSINCHSSTLYRKKNFVDLLAESASDNDIELNELIVEIVEHAPAYGGAGFHEALGRMRDLGIRIALDDIGAGQSSFRMMLECMPNYFKVDRYLVSRCDVDSRRREMLRSLVLLAERLGGQVVAEGVELEDEVAVLLGVGCRLFQGYLLGAPSTFFHHNNNGRVRGSRAI